MTGACAASSARSTRTTSYSTRPTGCTRPFRIARRTARRARRAIPAASRTSARSRDHRREPRCSERQCLLLSRHPARNEADGVLRLGRLRPDSEGADAHRGHAPFPVRELFTGQRHRRSFGCFEAGTPPGGCHDRRTPTISMRRTSRDYGIGLQEPRQPHLAHHAGRHAVLHVVAGIPTGWFQRRAAVRMHAPGPDGQPQYVTPSLVPLRQPDQQRDRLEDGVLRPSPAVERRRLPGELGQRADRVLRSRLDRQLVLQRPTARTFWSRASRPRSSPA